MSQVINTQPHLRAVPMTLFPTLGSLQEVIDMADSQLPLASKNTVISILMTYHNTLLLTQVKEKSWV
jgi:hypothetical protein